MFIIFYEHVLFASKLKECKVCPSFPVYMLTKTKSLTISSLSLFPPFTGQLCINPDASPPS